MSANWIGPAAPDTVLGLAKPAAKTYAQLEAECQGLAKLLHDAALDAFRANREASQMKDQIFSLELRLRQAQREADIVRTRRPGHHALEPSRNWGVDACAKIEAHHPGWIELTQTESFKAWLAQHPAYDHVFRRGMDAHACIRMLHAYKTDTASEPGKRFGEATTSQPGPDRTPRESIDLMLADRARADAATTSRLSLLYVPPISALACAGVVPMHTPKA